jgi:5,10-methylenetetrahydromethanopterin reductase
MDEPNERLRFGLTLQGVEPPVIFAEQVRGLEAQGFSHLWVTDSSLHARYVYAYLTLAALNSRRLQIGPGVTHPYTRHPAITANAIATIDEISGGRAMLGLGTGDRPTAELGFTPARIQVMREMIGLVRRLFAGEVVDHDGTFRLAQARLHYRQRDRLPIFVACSGPRMLRLAGELADGVIVQCGVFPGAVEWAMQHLGEGAARVGRSLDDLQVWVMACGVISDDQDWARQNSRTMAAWFAQTAPHTCQLAGLDRGLVERIQEAYSGGEFHHAQAAAALVPPEMVELFTLGGTPAQARARLEQLRDSGVQAINYMPTGPERAASLANFVQHVVAPLTAAPAATEAA